MKIKYQATLASGEIVTRRSDRTYTCYWHAIARSPNRTVQGGGFSSSRGLAGNAAQGFKSRFSSDRSCTVKIEIVPALIVRTVTRESNGWDRARRNSHES